MMSCQIILAFWSVLTYDHLEDWHIHLITSFTFTLLLYFINLKDSMLLCICSGSWSQCCHSQCDQLPFGLIARSVEDCTSIIGWCLQKCQKSAKICLKMHLLGFSPHCLGDLWPIWETRRFNLSTDGTPTNNLGELAYNCRCWHR